MAKANEGIEELTMMMPEQKGLIRTSTQQMSTHLVFLDEDITSPGNYRDVIHCLATCGENDNVNILINSSGGRADSAWSIMPRRCLCDCSWFCLQRRLYDCLHG
jgi:ATP-dependent protease ClpP protease subunit